MSFDKGVIEVRISELLGISRKEKPGKKLRSSLLITGILSTLVIVATLYGNYAGNAFISMTKDAQKKGIELSETPDFENGKSMINVETLEDFEDILESYMNIEEADNTDGLYYESDKNYYAYTFYLRNNGEEVVDINYRVRIVEERNNIGDAMFIKIKESVYKDYNAILQRDENYSRAITKTNIIANNTIHKFLPGDIRKFTLFVWADGEYTTPEMLDGYAKVDLTFSITNSGV